MNTLSITPPPFTWIHVKRSLGKFGYFKPYLGSKLPILGSSTANLVLYWTGTLPYTLTVAFTWIHGNPFTRLSKTWSLHATPVWWSVNYLYYLYTLASLLVNDEEYKTLPNVMLRTTDRALNDDPCFILFRAIMFLFSCYFILPHGRINIVAYIVRFWHINLFLVCNRTINRYMALINGVEFWLITSKYIA